MNKVFIYFISTIFLSLLFGCQNSKNENSNVETKSYINNFELLQENSKNNTRIRIISPKAIINQKNNDIEIFDSSIEILNSNGSDVKIKSGNSTLNNYSNLIRVYNKVFISLLNNNKSFIKTNSFDWDLNKSIIDLNNPLQINFENTVITSLKGLYNIDKGQLNITKNIFNRNILNDEGESIYRINILADNAKWHKNNNSLVFTSDGNQVETTIDILSNKKIN